MYYTCTNEDVLFTRYCYCKGQTGQTRKWNSIRLGKSLQETLAQHLHDNAGVPIGKCGIEENRAISNCPRRLPDTRCSIIYKGPESEKKIYLYLHDDHYDVITSMPTFLSKKLLLYKNVPQDMTIKERHRCNNICYACRKIHEVSTDNWIHCDDCNRYFRGPECFALHQKTVKGNSTCTIYRCTGCKKTINKKINKNTQVWTNVLRRLQRLFR